MTAHNFWLTMGLDVDVNARAATLQESVDAIVQTFEHPQALELTYESDGQEKRTIIHVDRGEGTETYELRFDASEDGNEPGIVPVPE